MLLCYSSLRHMAKATVASLCSVPQGLLLSAYLKMLLADPNDAQLRQQISAVYERYSHFMDADLQQRAVEYQGLMKLPDVASRNVTAMPKWEKRKSLLLRRMAEKEVGLVGHALQSWHASLKIIKQVPTMLFETVQCDSSPACPGQLFMTNSNRSVHEHIQYCLCAKKSLAHILLSTTLSQEANVDPVNRRSPRDGHVVAGRRRGDTAEASVAAGGWAGGGLPHRSQCWPAAPGGTHSYPAHGPPGGCRLHWP